MKARRLATYDRTNIGAQTYTYTGLGDRVWVDKPTGTRHFVYDALLASGDRVLAGSAGERAQLRQLGASASGVNAASLRLRPHPASSISSSPIYAETTP